MSKEELNYVLKRYEKKLKELMDEDAFVEFITDVSIEVVHMNIGERVDSDVKDFVMENLGKIVGEWNE